MGGQVSSSVWGHSDRGWTIASYRSASVGSSEGACGPADAESHTRPTLHQHSRHSSATGGREAHLSCHVH